MLWGDEGWWKHHVFVGAVHFYFGAVDITHAVVSSTLHYTHSSCNSHLLSLHRSPCGEAIAKAGGVVSPQAVDLHHVVAVGVVEA